VLIAENEPQDRRFVTPVKEGGYGLDGLWNDDFHHSVRVALTGFHEAYLSDYRGTPQEMVALARRGFLYQGQYYEWQKKNRGTMSPHSGPSFIAYLQNHDQVANHVKGSRLTTLADREQTRALTAFFLLASHTPMLFMGQEFEATSPFFYFTDHNPTLAPKVYEGRKHSLSEFPSYAKPEVISTVPDPSAESTFLRSKLDFSQRRSNQAGYLFHQDLLTLRRTDPVISRQDAAKIDGAVIGPHAFVVRFFDDQAHDRLLVVNYGDKYHYAPIPEPLLATPRSLPWKLLWCSKDSRYGNAEKLTWRPDHWELPARSALLLAL
jgi:maltooligosyltrehalose trehalohydrolase